MTYLNATSYKDFGDTTLAVYQAEFASVKSPMLKDVRSIYAALHGYTALALGQMYLENKYATTGYIIKPEDHNPLSLRPWLEDPRATKYGDVLKWDTREKVGAINVPPYADGAIVARDGSMMLRFPTWASGVTEWRRRLFDDANYKGGVYRNAVTLEQMLAIYAPPKDVHPETGADNADIKYPETVRAMLAKFARMEGATPSTGDTAVTTFTKHAFPGLPNPVYLPDWLKVTISIIPDDTPGWTSGQKVPAGQFTSTTYHDTQNDLSSAPSEYRWARDGGRAEINSAGSYNGIFDANGLIITQRFDELVGHAANPTGNVTSYAFEEAYGATGHDKSLEVGLWVHAGVLQAMGKSGGTESMYLHQFWSGKYCAKQVLDRGQWGYAEQTVDAHVAEINASLKQGDGTGGPTTPPPTTTYAKPVPIAELAGYTVSQDDEVAGIVTREGGDDFIFTADLYEAVVATPRLQYADIKNSPKVGPDLIPGEKFIGAWLVKARDGEWYIVTPYWTRILFKEGVVKRIGDVPNLAAGAA